MSLNPFTNSISIQYPTKTHFKSSTLVDLQLSFIQSEIAVHLETHRSERSGSLAAVETAALTRHHAVGHSPCVHAPLVPLAACSLCSCVLPNSAAPDSAVCADMVSAADAQTAVES